MERLGRCFGLVIKGVVKEVHNAASQIKIAKLKRKKNNNKKTKKDLKQNRAMKTRSFTDWAMRSNFVFPSDLICSPFHILDHHPLSFCSTLLAFIPR